MIMWAGRTRKISPACPSELARNSETANPWMPAKGEESHQQTGNAHQRADRREHGVGDERPDRRADQEAIHGPPDGHDDGSRPGKDAPPPR